MTGIIIFTAGREDAYRDYQRSVKSGHTFDELEPHLSEGVLELLTETYEGDTAHGWSTSIQSKWDGAGRHSFGLVALITWALDTLAHLVLWGSGCRSSPTIMTRV